MSTSQIDVWSISATGNLNSFIASLYLQTDTDTLLLAGPPAPTLSVCYTLHVNTHVHIIIKDNGLSAETWAFCAYGCHHYDQCILMLLVYAGTEGNRMYLISCHAITPAPQNPDSEFTTFKMELDENM